MLLLLLVPFVSTCGEVAPSASSELSGLMRAETQRIIGGVKAREGSWPWQTLIRYRDYRDGIDYLCGGALVSKRHILTAAHCTITMDIRATKIFLGTSSQIPKNGVLVRVIRKAVHPSYSLNEVVNPSEENDIALLTVVFSDRIRPVCLPGANFPLDDFGYVTGFGMYTKGMHVVPRPNDFLLQSILPIVDYENCRDKWEYDLVDYGGGIVINNRTQICAGAVGHGSAQGDSGGPFVQKGGDGRWYQVGIVSFGINDGKGYLDQAMAPGIYTRVSAYCDWIRQTTDGEASCRDEASSSSRRAALLGLFALLLSIA